MQNKLLIVLVFLLSVLLTGCSCEHQWTEADCLNPQICSKCKEFGAEALGHSWSAATCEQPETCSRCGETQGAALGHSYGNWDFTDDRMTHSCDVCQAEESKELDQGEYLDSLLPGYWEFHSVFRQGQYYSSQQLKTPGDRLHFEPGRKFTGLLNQEECSGTWELLEYIEKGGASLYRIEILESDGSAMEIRLVRQQQGDTLFAFYADDTQVLMTRNDDIAAGIVGTWADQEDPENGISLTFREDRTLIWKLGEEAEGIWQLTPMVDLGTMQYYGLRMAIGQGDAITYVEGSAVYYNTTSTTPHAILLHWNAENTEHGTTTLFPRRN